MTTLTKIGMVLTLIFTIITVVGSIISITRAAANEKSASNFANYESDPINDPMEKYKFKKGDH